MREGHRHWHVTVTVAGEDIEPLIVRNALRRLSDQRPFFKSMNYSANRAEIQYWEQAETLIDASSLALRVWNEHRDSAGLPRWEVVGLEVLERTVFLARDIEHATLLDMRDVKPLPF